MIGRESNLRKEAAVNLSEVAASTQLRKIRQQGYVYVELRRVGRRISFFCILCLTPCYSETVLFVHLGGNLHKRRLAGAKATLFGATPWPFDDGVLFFDTSTETDMLMHDAPGLGRNCSCGASSRSSCSVADEVTTCNWADNSLIIPGVLLKQGVSGLAVQPLGVGQIAYRVQENKESRGKIITRIWCAWLGQEGSNLSDELNVPVTSQYAIVNFPYAYGLGRKPAPGDEDLPMQPMLPRKDVATLLNRRTGNLACSSRNTTGAFHPFHASCLIHWILICELEMLADQKQSTETTEDAREDQRLENRISSVFCPECQGTGISIQGEELEKPTVPLSEMLRYKLKTIEATEAWMKNPEMLKKCSTGLHFPSDCTENSEENVVPLKLLHFFRAHEQRQA
ncbi:unnamed protein product [Musa acuminata subsp. malaccensis]|uniref:(wild Malaysian banana) hypothetical protein n=1 Tax=Musa acuminata subsp. malaccensis TaxID=214687 RepID=A0A804ISA5_MUSAM|nr:unnamed protein product [Musa acuminata subsp. malaccensis]